MKYRVANNIKGGFIPKINTEMPKNKRDQMNVLAPLYFNTNKDPIISEDNTMYNYGFNYLPSSRVLQIDKNLDLNLTSKNLAHIVSNPAQDSNRVLIVNGMEIPYYLGKFHNRKKLFGRIKSLFEYVKIEIVEGQVVKTPIWMERDVIDLINSMFNISDTSQDLIGINQRLENPIDKYIFINKFYEFLEMITWRPGLIEEISEEFLNNPTFRNIKIVNTNDQIKKFITENNIIGLINYYKQKNSKVEFNTKVYGSLKKPDEKRNYIQIIRIIDYFYGKLNEIFTDDVTREGDGEKINLINLIDLYTGYNPVFLNETNIRDNNNLLLCKNLESIEKTNKTSKGFNYLMGDLVIELIELVGTLEKIKNWEISKSINTPELKLHIILILSYFDLRLKNNQIKQGTNLNALPINKTAAKNNLFGSGHSIDYRESTKYNSEELVNTESFIKLEGTGPIINDRSPVVYIKVIKGTKEFTINFPACVENCILQLCKYLFWDFEKSTYDIEKLDLPENNFIQSIIAKIISNPNNEEDDELIEEFVEPLIDLDSVDYVNNNWWGKTVDYELNANSQNVLKILRFILTSSVDEISNKGRFKRKYTDDEEEDLEFLNEFLSEYDFEIESEPKFILKYDEVPVLELKLDNDEHASVFKPSNTEISTIYPNVKNFYNYLLFSIDESVRSDYRIYNDIILTDQIDVSKDIDENYISTSKIFWLNFIEDFTGFGYIDISEDLRPIFNIKMTEYLHRLINKNFTKSKIPLYKININLMYYLIAFSLNVDFDTNESVYNLINTEYIDRDPDILNRSITGYNNIYYYVLKNTNYKYMNSLTKLFNRLKQIDERKLYLYDKNEYQPIQLMIKLLNFDLIFRSEESIINFIELAKSLIDSTEYVLTNIRDGDIDDMINPELKDINSIPLYLFFTDPKDIDLEYNKNLIEIWSNAKDLVPELKLETLEQIIGIFIDSKRVILNKYEPSVLECYIKNSVSNYIQLVKYEYYPKEKLDSYLTIPIRSLQTPRNLIESETGISLFYYVINICQRKKYDTVLIINHFVSNSLLNINSEENYCEIIKIYPQGSPSILYIYVNEFTESNFDHRVFTQLYCKELLVTDKLTPLNIYVVKNFLNVDITILELLSRIHEGKNPICISNKIITTIMEFSKDDNPDTQWIRERSFQGYFGKACKSFFLTILDYLTCISQTKPIKLGTKYKVEKQQILENVYKLFSDPKIVCIIRILTRNKECVEDTDRLYFFILNKFRVNEKIIPKEIDREIISLLVN